MFGSFCSVWLSQSIFRRSLVLFFLEANLSKKVMFIVAESLLVGLLRGLNDLPSQMYLQKKSDVFPFLRYFQFANHYRAMAVQGSIVCVGGGNPYNPIDKWIKYP